MKTSTTQTTDEVLLERFLGGDEAAFVIIVKRYMGPVISYAYRFLGDYDDAVDVAQETFIKLFRFAHTFAGEVKFSTWLYTIAANLSRTELNRYRKRFGISLQFAFRHSEDDETFDIPGESYRPDEKVDRDRIAKEVQKALLKVAPSYREMIVLRDVQQLSYEEIALITHTELGTVKSRINRGRAQLKVLLTSLYVEIFPEYKK